MTASNNGDTHTHTRVTDELPLMVLACIAQETSFGVKDSGAGHSTDQAKGLLVHWTEVDPALLVVNLTLKLATFSPCGFLKYVSISKCLSLVLTHVCLV